MTTPDLVNGLYEAGGGLMLLRNVRQLHRDKQVRGVSILTSAFFASWGWWNLYYYPHLSQWLSFIGGVLVTAVNGVWVAQMVYYTYRRAR